MLSREIHQAIIHEYKKYGRVDDIHRKYGITRQAVWKILKRYGVDTQKKMVPVHCYVCGKPIERFKCRMREHRHHFCTRDCYYAWQRARFEQYKPNSYFSREVYRNINDYIKMERGYTIHFINGDREDCRVQNIMVFKSEKDHLDYEQGKRVKPLFDGRKRKKVKDAER
jgi:hypothetical protein